MPISVTCSECNSTYRVADDAAGKAIKCKKCGARIAVPAADDDLSALDTGKGTDGDGAAEGTDKPKKKGGSGKLIAIIASVLVGTCCICTGIGGTVGYFLYTRSRDAVNDLQKDLAKFQKDRKGVVAGGATVFEQNATLTKNDPKFRDPKSNQEKPAKAYRVKLEAGKRYVIDLKKQADGDPYLVLLNPQGKEVARDDDGGDGLNAQIRYTPPVTGDYTIQATARSRVFDPANRDAVHADRQARMTRASGPWFALQPPGGSPAENATTGKITGAGPPAAPGRPSGHHEDWTMPIPITCPSCNATDRIADGLAGTIVACRQCGARLAVPGGIGDGETGIQPPPVGSTRAMRHGDDYDDDAPRRSIAKPKQSGGSWLWVIAGGVLALGCLGCMGLGIGVPVLGISMGWWAGRQEARRAEAQVAEAQGANVARKEPEKALQDALKALKERPPQNMPIKDAFKDFREGQVKGGRGRLMLDQQGRLMPDDPVRDFKQHKAYQVRLEQGRTYVLRAARTSSSRCVRSDAVLPHREARPTWANTPRILPRSGESRRASVRR